MAAVCFAGLQRVRTHRSTDHLPRHGQSPPIWCRHNTERSAVPMNQSVTAAPGGHSQPHAEFPTLPPRVLHVITLQVFSGQWLAFGVCCSFHWQPNSSSSSVPLPCHYAAVAWVSSCSVSLRLCVPHSLASSSKHSNSSVYVVLGPFLSHRLAQWLPSRPLIGCKTVHQIKQNYTGACNQASSVTFKTRSNTLNLQACNKTKSNN